MRRWSKLQRSLYGVIDEKINFQIHLSKYRMQSRYGSTDLPRYWITLNGEIIFDYPKQFPHESYPYVTDIPQICNLIEEYVNTPKERIFSEHFANDRWGLANILKAADRRNGTRRLMRLKRKVHNKAALKIIAIRLNGGAKHMEQDITLNIHYTIPADLWEKLLPSIKKLDANGIEYSVEPGGLQLYGEMPQKQWDSLIEEFCKSTSEILGFPVGDACGDFPCVPFDR